MPDVRLTHSFNRAQDTFTVPTNTMKGKSISKATITQCDLSSGFFRIDATLLCKFESDKV